jgi:hypothetical protein
LRTRISRDDATQPTKTDFDSAKEYLRIRSNDYKYIGLEEKAAIELAIGCMKSEVDLLDQMERMNLGQTRTNIDQLLDAINVLKKLKE